jgi:hypothetical protein
MTANPNTDDTSDYSNNYFYSYSNTAWRQFVWNAILYSDVLNLTYKGRKISMPVPPKEDVPDYRTLMNAIDQKIREMGLK